MSTRSLLSAPPRLEITDSTSLQVPANFLLHGSTPREPTPHIARLANQFISQNSATLAALGVTIAQRYSGESVALELQTSTTIGAVPLKSPSTGRLDYGLVVKPRFDWSGIGPMLAEMGLRITPSILPLPVLPRSERRVPPWVMSSVVLARIAALLGQLSRRFEMTREDRSAPRGSVDWQEYGARRVTSARFTSVPCEYPDLREDEALRGAIRFALLRQLDSLGTQINSGTFVRSLMDYCDSLVRLVSDSIARSPSARDFDRWLRSPLHTETFREGLQAVEWTIDDRGLGGLSDLEGLPWKMSMEEFFEAWTETVVSAASVRMGGVLRSGRQRQTVTPIEWRPPYRGSQKSLRPDVILDRGDLTVIVEAKYKEHWEELQQHRWGDLEERLRERHRDDLLQVLAYASVTATPRVVLCLAYPCRRETWRSLDERGLLFSKATLRNSGRRIDLLLTAFPMGVWANEVGDRLASEVMMQEE